MSSKSPGTKVDPSEGPITSGTQSTQGTQAEDTSQDTQQESGGSEEQQPAE